MCIYFICTVVVGVVNQSFPVRVDAQKQRIAHDDEQRLHARDGHVEPEQEEP